MGKKVRKLIKKVRNFFKRKIKRGMLIRIEHRHIFHENEKTEEKRRAELILQEGWDSDAELYNIKAIDISGLDKADYKWCGGVRDFRYFYAIPNDAQCILKIDMETGTPKIIRIPFSQTRGWTGGAIYQDVLYGFPRSANYLLAMDIKSQTVKMIPLGTNYLEEHHYGGVVTQSGILYQPPRNTNHILKINLNTKKCEKIYIDSVNRKMTYRYTTGVVHRNGLIYFFPERGEKVMVLRLEGERIYFIGDRLNAMAFGGAIACDDNIYGFSAYEEGILYINTQKNTAQMIHREIGVSGCYGTKVGRNGKIYGIPGNQNWIWEYDCVHDIATRKMEMPEDLKECTYAGAAVSDEGDIWCVPVKGGGISLYYVLQENSKLNMK